MQAIARQKDGSSAATHGPGLQQHCIAGVLQECWKTTKLDITHNARAIPVVHPHLDYPHLDYPQLDYPHLDLPQLDWDYPQLDYPQLD